MTISPFRTFVSSFTKLGPQPVNRHRIESMSNRSDSQAPFTSCQCAPTSKLLYFINDLLTLTV